jgi:hypothetical protein
MRHPVTRIARVLSFFCGLTLLLAPFAGAQDASSPLTPDQIAAQIKPLHPKTVVLVFDVTGSTRSNGVFSNERAASSIIIRDGCEVGDRIVLEAFGTGYKTIFDQRLTGDTEKDSLIEQLPPGITPGAGTNIRWPHAEALRLVQHDLPRPGVIVLLTDSFNDRPLTTDPNYPKYLDYYTLKGLTVYPDTRENRDYERLLRTLKASGQLHQYGVGVGIAPSGRPIERLPVGPGQGDDSSDTTSVAAPTVLAPTGTPRSHDNYALYIVAGILILAFAFFFFSSRPIRVRLRLGDKGTPHDYRLKLRTKIALGGSPTTAGASDEVFPLAGVPTPAAFVISAGGSAHLCSAPTMPAGVGVFHNGLRFGLKPDESVPLRIGDEIRVSLAAEGVPGHEHYVHFDDPKAAAF